MKAGHVSKLEKIRAASASLATAAIQQPHDDWAPLLYAPFYYGSSGYLRTLDEWQHHLDSEVKKSSSSTTQSRRISKWSLKTYETTERVAVVTAGGISTMIYSTGLINVFGPSRSDQDCSPDFQFPVTNPDYALDEEGWGKFPSKLQSAANWHQQVVFGILCSFQFGFGAAVMSGAAHIMARKNTVLAPFERVTWDQWQGFKLDPNQTQPATWNCPWYDPRRTFLDELVPLSSATGPVGEKLFSIHIAPSMNRNLSDLKLRQLTTTQECLHWLIDYMRRFPDRQPKPLKHLFKEAKSRFPDLTERGFRVRIMSEAERRTRIMTWREPGRLQSSR